MKNSLIAISTFVALVAVSILPAQEPPKVPGPEKQHEWLKQFVGEWESEAEGTAGPGQPSMKCKGTMSSRMLGELWLISESKVDMLGTTVNAIQTIGYDPAKKKYVATWVDSMFNYLWKYEGTVDATGKILTFDAEGPSFVAEGKTAKYRDTYEFKSQDHIVVTSSMQSADGKWATFMTAQVRRKK